MSEKQLIGSLELNRIYQMDCIEGMKLIPDKSIDMILCDLPYGTTRNKWDNVIPFDLLWEQYERIIKDNGAIVLTAAQPFTSLLVTSNLKLFKYDLVWEKSQATGFLNAKKMPLRKHESILVFYKSLPTYNPQFTDGKPYVAKSNAKANKGNYGKFNDNITINEGKRYPVSILPFKNGGKTYHPTQKPVALFEYLIKTYTNEGEVVLDNCMGSGTTAVAALRTGRHFIGFEIDPEYVRIANQRLENVRDELAEQRLAERKLTEMEDAKS
jgi:site-specific DNA-methyltransferase (adenine-specific)